MILKNHVIYIILVLLMLCSCSKAQKSPQAASHGFSADSAYQYVAAQVEFGARVPGTTAHYECSQYLQQQLRRFGAEVELQQGQMPDYKGDMQQVVNIIGHFSDGQSAAKRRILLCSHWDSRPWADQEEDYDQRMQPVLGANDGASGVGVLLEVARQLALKMAKGEAVPAVDIVFFDCEDMGTPDFYTGKERENTWCLGSQMWSERLLGEGVRAKGEGVSAKDYKYGILLDMVGAPDAVFYKEYYSVQFAPNYTEKIWRAAASLGYGGLFRDAMVYPITDDHYYVNTIAGIPCVDIIHYDNRNGTGFAHWWHTAKDDMRNISPATLQAVGETVLETIMN